MLLGALACPAPVSPVDEELSISGTLDRDSISEATSAGVPTAYRSRGARAEWWPCDLRLTALGCVDDYHVNVYIALPSATGLEHVGTAACVRDGEPDGVFELLRRRGGTGSYAIGSDVSVFVLVASNKDEQPGAVLNDDEETKAATRLGGGTLRVERWAGLDGIGLVIEGTTRAGRDVLLTFQGPGSSPSVVPPLEGPASCVESALVEP